MIFNVTLIFAYFEKTIEEQARTQTAFLIVKLLIENSGSSQKLHLNSDVEISISC